MDDVYGRYRDALRLGHQLAAEGRFKDALHQYQAAADVAGERALPHVAVGGMLMRLGQPREALAAFDRALEREPNDPDALSGRAAALLKAGRRTEAAQVQALIAQQREAGPVSAPAGDATPMTHADNLMATGEQARAGGRAPAAIDAWLAESVEHRAAKHHDAALDACLRALALDSSAARTHLELTRVWLARGWNDRAVVRMQLLDRLLALQPDATVATALHSLYVAERPADTGKPETAAH